MAKKKLGDLINDEFDEEEAKLPPPPIKYPAHIRLYRAIKRRIKRTAPDIPPTKAQMDLLGFMNAAARDRLLYMQDRVGYYGYPVDTVDEFNRTALWYAALRGAESVTGWLLGKESIKSKLDMKDTVEGWTPLHAACTSTSEGQIPAIKRLVDALADIDIRDNRGRTPLTLSIICGNLDVAEFLIENGASLDKRDKATWMPIHHAVYDNNDEAIDLLLEKGCRFRRKDQLKMRAIDWAERMKYTDIVEVIKDWGDEHPVGMIS